MFRDNQVKGKINKFLDLHVVSISYALFISGYYERMLTTKKFKVKEDQSIEKWKN